MDYIDILFLGVITGLSVTDFYPKFTGYFQSKNGGKLEKKITPLVSPTLRVLSYTAVALGYYFLARNIQGHTHYFWIIIIFFILMGVIPQDTAIYEKGLKARGHFFFWDNIDNIAGNKNNTLFKIRLKKGFRKNYSVAIAVGEKKLFLKLLQKKSIKVDIK